jgi:hypothetical protein
LLLARKYIEKKAGPQPHTAAGPRIGGVCFAGSFRVSRSRNSYKNNHGHIDSGSRQNAANSVPEANE